MMPSQSVRLSQPQLRMLALCKAHGWQDVRGPRWRTAQSLYGLGLVDWHRVSTGAIIGVKLTPAGREALADAP
jgi:hypothetical protein